MIDRWDAACTGKAEMLTPLRYNSSAVETVRQLSYDNSKIKRQSTPLRNEVVGTCNSAIRKAQWANPAQTPALGSTLSVVLPKAGIGRFLLVTCSLPITIATAACVPSPKAPFNTFINAHLQDYSGVDRINSSVFMLAQHKLLSKHDGWEPSSSYPYVAAGAAGVEPYAVGAAYPFGITAPYADKAAQGGSIAGSFMQASRWSVPTAISSANLVFSFWLPISFGPKDPRGALLLNVPNGQVVLQLTFNNALVATTGIDTPYQSATGTCVLNNPSTANIYVYTYSTVGRYQVTDSCKRENCWNGETPNQQRSLAA